MREIMAKIKDQLAAVLKEIRAQTAKLEVFSTDLDSVSATLERLTGVPAKPITALDASSPVTALDSSSPTPTVSMASSVDIHGAAPPSSGHSSVAIPTAKLIPELPVKCAPLSLVHNVCRIPGLATPLGTRGVSAASRSAPPAPARRWAAALELDKPTPTSCLVFGLRAAAFNDKSTGDDAYNGKSTGVVPVSSEAALFVGLLPCAVPKSDGPAHTRCSTKFSDISACGTSIMEVLLPREDLFLGCSSPDKVQALRPVPWPSFVDDTIDVQSRSPWPSFKVTSGSKFPTDAITNPFEWCYPFYQPPWPPPRIDTTCLSRKGLQRQGVMLKPWPDELQHQSTGGVGPVVSSPLAAIGDKWVLPSWDSGRQAGVLSDQSSSSDQYTSCFPGYFLTSGQMQLSDACSTWQLFVSASSTSLLLAKFLLQAKEPSGILIKVSMLAEAKSIGSLSSSHDYILVNELYNAGIFRGPVLSWFGNGKEPKCIWGAEQLLGETDGMVITKIFQGAVLVIFSGDEKLQVQSLSADYWRLFRVAGWKGMNQVAGNCKQSCQGWYHTVQSARTHFSNQPSVLHITQSAAQVLARRVSSEMRMPYSEPRENPLYDIITVKMHGVRLVQYKLVLLTCKASMMDGYTTFVVPPLLEPVLLTHYTNKCLLKMTLGRSKLVGGVERGLIDSAASGFRCGSSDLDLYWSALNMCKSAKRYQQLANILDLINDLLGEFIPIIIYGPTISSPKTTAKASLHVVTAFFPQASYIPGHQPTHERVTLVTWLCAPWDPGGGILQVLADGGLRASRMLRRGECHVPTVTWAVGWMPRQEGWAAAGYQAHSRCAGRLDRMGRRSSSYLSKALAHDIGIEDQTTGHGSLPCIPLLYSFPPPALDSPIPFLLICIQTPDCIESSE